MVVKTKKKNLGYFNSIIAKCKSFSESGPHSFGNIPSSVFSPFFQKHIVICIFPFCTVIFVSFFICNVFCWCDYVYEVQNRKVFSVCFFSGHYYYSFPFLIMTENNVVLQRRQTLQKGSTPDVRYLQYTTATAISELNTYDFDSKDRYI